MRISKPEKPSFLSCAGEWTALLLVIHYCFFRFFESSTFYFDFSLRYRQITFGALVIVGILRMLTGLWRDLRTAESSSQKRNIILRGVLALFFSVPCILVADRFGYAFLAYLPFAAFCLYGIDAQKVLKVFAAATAVLFLCTMWCADTGAIENYLYLAPDKGKMRGSYGIAYPTDFASYFIYLYLFFWGSRKRDAWWSTALFAALAGMMCWFVYTYPHSDTSTICSLVCLFVVLYEALDRCILKKHRGTRWLSRLGEGATVFAFPILGAAALGMAWLYGHGNGFAFRLDEWMSTHISVIWNHYVKYGIHALGALTPQNGAGHGLIHTETYEFLDSTYGMLLIRYGWILTLIVTFLWVWMSWRALKTGHRKIALAMAVIAVHSVMEHHFTELNFNILLAMPLCAFGFTGGLQGREEKQKQDAAAAASSGGSVRPPAFSGWGPWAAGAVTVGCAALILPRLLSWQRTLFFLRGWTGGGTKSLAALLICLVCLAAIAAVWLSLTFLIADWKKEKAVPVLTTLGLLTVLVGVGTVMAFMDETLREGIGAAEARISADERAVRLILDSAEEPVYGGPMEEAYKRRYGGFADHYFSDQELGRGARGTMLLDHGNEGYQLMGTGARYTEISPYTGLFTYDESVVKALQDEGYRFHGYFSAEQEVNLASLGPLNQLGLSESGDLMLSGAEHSLIYGPYLDQFAGTYQTAFTIQLRDIDPSREDPEQEVCVLRVSALWGQNIRMEKVLRMKDFLDNDVCTAELNYSIGNTKGIEYLVFCREDIPVWVKKIAWKKNPATDTWKKYTAEGFVQSERYFTADGEPLRQTAGHYGTAYEYGNGNSSWTRMQYLDADGSSLKMISSGYAQILRKYDELRHVTEERYLDAEGNSCLCTGNYAGYSRTYNPRGYAMVTRYFDTGDHLIRTTGGYAVTEWDYDDANNRIYERYLDENEQPVLISAGYAELHRVYDQNRRVIRESYYGPDGQPKTLSKNQAGVAYEYDENGNTIRWVYLDADGQPVMLTDGWAELRRAYNEKKWIIEESYYNERSELILRPAGYAIVRRGYDNVGNIVSERYFDAGDRPVKSTAGYAEYRRTYNSDNRVIHEAYYDTDGTPLSLSRNQAAVEYEYDAAGNCVRYRYLDASGNPVLLTDGYAELRRKYSYSKKVTEEAYFDTEGRPSNIFGRYAAFRNEYDGADQLSLTFYSDAEGNPVQCGSGYFHEYLQSLQGRGLTIFISAKDEATGALTPVLLEDLRSLGIQTDLKGKYRYSYYAVISPDGVTEDLSSTETISRSGRVSGLDYTIVSGGYTVGNTSSIVLNGTEYSKNTRGMNMVIADSETGTVMASIAFDTNVQEMRVTR